MTGDWWLTVVAALAVYRVAVLLTADAILDRPRGVASRRGGKLAEFVVCPWCVSVWVAAVVVVVDACWGTPTWLADVYLAAAFSAVAGLLASH